MDELFTLNEACSILKINNHTIRMWRDRNIIELVRLPTGRLRVRQSEINRIVNGGEHSDPIKEEMLKLEHAIKMVFENYVIKVREGKWVDEIANILKKQKLGFTYDEIVEKIKELISQRRISDVDGKGTRMVLLDEPKTLGGDKTK